MTLTLNLLHVGYSLTVRAPIELYNALPIPVNIGLKSSHHKQGSWRVTVQPLQTCVLNQAGAFQDVQSFQLEPTGYAASPNMHIPTNTGRSRYSSSLRFIVGIIKVVIDLSSRNCWDQSGATRKQSEGSGFQHEKQTVTCCTFVSVGLLPSMQQSSQSSLED